MSEVKIDFAKVKEAYAEHNGVSTKLKRIYIAKGDGLPQVYYDERGQIFVLSLVWEYSNMGEIVTHTESWRLAENTPWSELMEIDTQSQEKERFQVTSDGSIFFDPGITGLHRTFWLVHNSNNTASETDFVNQNDLISSTDNYMFISRTKAIEENVRNIIISIGSNQVVVDSEATICLFMPQESGTYRFEVNSNNALLGYAEPDSDEIDWYDKTYQDLKLEAGKCIYILCSTQDFSAETFILEVNKVNVLSIF